MAAVDLFARPGTSMATPDYVRYSMFIILFWEGLAVEVAVWRLLTLSFHMVDSLWHRPSHHILEMLYERQDSHR